MHATCMAEDLYPSQDTDLESMALDPAATERKKAPATYLLAGYFWRCVRSRITDSTLVTEHPEQCRKIPLEFQMRPISEVSALIDNHSHAS